MAEDTQDNAGERARARKAMALKQLATLGFIDRNDAQCPGAIWHPGTDITLDMDTLRVVDVIGAIHQEGRDRGRRAVQDELQRLIGIANG